MPGDEIKVVREETESKGRCLVSVDEAESLTEEHRYCNPSPWELMPKKGRGENISSKRVFTSPVSDKSGTSVKGLRVEVINTRGRRIDMEKNTATLFRKNEKFFDERVIQVSTKYPFKGDDDKPHIHFGVKKEFVDFDPSTPPTLLEVTHWFEIRSNIEFSPPVKDPDFFELSND